MASGVRDKDTKRTNHSKPQNAGVREQWQSIDNPLQNLWDKIFRSLWISVLGPLLLDALTRFRGLRSIPVSKYGQLPLE
jgi:hypothetical protein